MRHIIRMQALLCLYVCGSLIPAAAQNTYQGRVLDAITREPIDGAYIQFKNARINAISDGSGIFRFTVVPPADSIFIRSVNHQTLKAIFNAAINDYVLVPISGESSVTVQTGYQSIPKERATGSFVQVNQTLLNRRVSTNLLERLDGVTSGVLFNPRIEPGKTSSDNKAAISIRGRATLLSNPNPLIILDNFPYEGSIDNINPNDVESVTILKDAAASSIWGSLAGNGVIVITSKKGKHNQPMQVTFNANTTFQSRPNLFYAPQLASTDFIDVEQFLYSKGAYASTLSSTARPVVSPVVEILARQTAGLLTPAEATAQINQLRMLDIRKDQEKYSYRNGLNQQYSIGLSGGNASSRYRFSIGYDKNLTIQMGNDYSRYTLNAQHTLILIPGKLDITTSLAYTQTKTNENYAGVSTNYPYAQIANANGQALALPRSYRSSYLDTAGQGKLLDWKYRPLEEMQFADNSTRVADQRIGLQLFYRPLRGLEASLQYQYNSGTVSDEQYNPIQSWFARDLINQFTQINFVTGSVANRIPAGGIMTREERKYHSHNARLQLSYERLWGEHSVSVLGGGEVRSNRGVSASYRLYGYDKDLRVSVPVDYTTAFTSYVRPTVSAQIPYVAGDLATINNFVSLYANGTYRYRSRYTFSASVRKDESNIFGVSANLKGVPLYSIGLAWEINREKWYAFKGMSYLNLRITDGYSGNVYPSLSAYTTASYGGTNIYGSVQASLTNPPNPSLGWEKVHINNIGLDFATPLRRISGSIEGYFKTGSGLIADAPVDPTTGVASFTGNTADMKARGIDLTLNAELISRETFQWSAQFLFNYVTDEVTRYLVKKGSIGGYVSSISINPQEGRPVYGLYSYKWIGLDAAGNPQGMLDGKTSTAYTSFSSSTDFNNLAFNGRTTPSVFGSFRNTIRFKEWQFSFNVSYKFGYVFRDVSINYTSLFNVNGGAGHPDYLSRWQQPGDEARTHIPAMVYPNVNGRDLFYTNSDVLVQSGNHIRLQDIQISYSLLPTLTKRLHLQGVRCYAYANNIGILWRKNKQGIDPDAGAVSAPAARSYSLGLAINF